MRPVPFVLVLLFVLSAIAGEVPAGEAPPADSDPYLTDWQLGGRHMDEGRYRDAIDVYQRYIDEVPKAVGARIYMGYACEQLGQKEKARQLYRDAADIYPDFAMDYFNEEPGPHPGIADAMCDIGISYVKRGRILDALEVFEDALSVYPDHVEAHFRLGAACLDLGEKEYALEAYESLRRLDGEKASAGQSRAIAHSLQFTHILWLTCNCIEPFPNEPQPLTHFPQPIHNSSSIVYSMNCLITQPPPGRQVFGEWMEAPLRWDP